MNRVSLFTVSLFTLFFGASCVVVGWLGACVILEIRSGLKPTTFSESVGSTSREVKAESIDWWDDSGGLPHHERVFNKSIFYIKPHKTGSESFKRILHQISEYYNLTIVPLRRHRRAKKGQGGMLPKDILSRHQHYKEGVTERQIRGWENGEFKAGKNGQPPKRNLTRIITARNPIDRLFSHYFSERRFGNFVPKRGHVKKGRLSLQEELSDFLEWLDGYPPNQQIMYLMDTPLIENRSDHNTVMLQRIDKIVKFYDHVVLADHWKQSVCLFGYIEGIKPQLLELKAYNSNKKYRFDTQKAISDSNIFEKVLLKVQYDFILYQALFRKYSNKLDEVSSAEMQRYCTFIK